MERESAPSPTDGPPEAEQLLKKIQELELDQARLKQEISKLKSTSTPETAASDRHHKQRSHSVSPNRTARRRPAADPNAAAAAVWNKGSASLSFRHSSPLQRESHDSHGCSGSNGKRGGGGPAPAAAVQFTDKHYLNILQSMGNAVHIFDLNCRIIYWNKSAESLYGYSAGEALGQDPVQLLTDLQDFDSARNIVNCLIMGESWTGQFPVKIKNGDRIRIAATNTPFYDDDGTLVGVICVSSDPRAYQEVTAVMSAGNLENESRFNGSRKSSAAKTGLDSHSQQPLQIAGISKVSYKVKLNMPSGKELEHEGSSGYRHCYEHGLPEAVTSEHREDAASSGGSTPRGDAQPTSFGVYSSGSHEENYFRKLSRDSGDESEAKPCMSRIKEEEKKGLAWAWKGNERDEATGSWPSSANVNSSSSCGSTSSCILNRTDIDYDCLDYEILWDDLTIGEQIGQGSCGTVYHALWYGSDVAVKVFSKQEYSNDAILSFKQEVSLMKRLRHPNILLFMGAVTSPERLCMVTEFLPRGSLFRLLQRNTSKLDWRRRIHMALDVARGMNHLHHCNPPIVHLDLKSSNLLVDKNWTVKVSDFGLSRLKRETYLTTKTGKGTPQWMAPEVLRNEPADEKADVYSFGVVLWELATQKIPWENLNSMQVMVSVGFMDQRLEIPEDIDSRWASLMENCWHSDPQCRPSFQELVERLKELQRQYTVQNQSGRPVARDSTQKEV